MNTNLLGISGYLSSGKDTVGQIIQYLTSDCSKSQGKHYRTFEKWKQSGQGDNSYQGWYQSDWKIKKYAEKLKQIASILTGIPVEKFEDQEFKKTFLGPEWNHKYDVPMTIREFLQRLGTEAIREGIHNDAWGNALFADYEPILNQVDLSGMHRNINGKFTVPKSGYIPEEYWGVEVNDIIVKWYTFPKWIITDTRFENEAQRIKDRGGIIIRVSRPIKFENVPSGSRIDVKLNLHSSETSLDNWKFDEIIDNNGSIEELIEKVKEILIKYKII